MPKLRRVLAACSAPSTITQSSSLFTSWKEVFVESHIKLALTSIAYGAQPVARRPSPQNGRRCSLGLRLGRVVRDACVPYSRFCANSDGHVPYTHAISRTLSLWVSERVERNMRLPTTNSWRGTRGVLSRSQAQCSISCNAHEPQAVFFCTPRAVSQLKRNCPRGELQRGGPNPQGGIN